MIPVRLARRQLVHSDCGQEYLARGAQQQARQREERGGEEGAEKLGLLHGGDYSPKSRTKATFPASVGALSKVRRTAASVTIALLPFPSKTENQVCLLAEPSERSL